MKQFIHLNPSEETGTRCPVTSEYGRTPPNKQGGVGRNNNNMVLPFLLRAASVKVILFRLCMVCKRPLIFSRATLSLSGVHVMIAVAVDWSWALMLGSGTSVRADDRKTSSENMYSSYDLFWFC